VPLKQNKMEVMFVEKVNLDKAYEIALQTADIDEDELSEHYYWFTREGILFRFRRLGFMEYEWVLVSEKEAIEITEEEAEKILSQQK